MQFYQKRLIPYFGAFCNACRCSQIHHEEFDFRHYEKDTLQMLESICVYPPRFVVTYQRNNPSIQLSSKITVSTGVKVIMEFIVNDDSDAMQGT